MGIPARDEPISDSYMFLCPASFADVGPFPPPPTLPSSSHLDIFPSPQRRHAAILKDENVVCFLTRLGAAEY